MIEVLAARASWCVPDEKILWCHPLTRASGAGKFILYTVPGLDDWGAQKPGVGRKALVAATGVAALVLEAALGGGDQGGSAPSVPWTVLMGKRRDCLAVSCLADWQANGGNSSSRDDQELFWVLTTHRLGLLDFAQRGEGGNADSSGLLGGLKKSIGSVFERAEEPQAEKEPQLPVPLVCAEIPRNAITSVEVVEQKIQGRDRHWFKVGLADESALLVSDWKKSHERAFFDRMLAMTHGRE